METIWTGLAGWLLTSCVATTLLCAAAVQEKRHAHHPTPPAAGPGRHTPTRDRPPVGRVPAG